MRIASRRWKIIFGSMFAAIAFAALLTALATPTYSSSARLFVSTAQGDSTQAYQGSLFSAARIGSYADLVGSREVSETVVDDLGLSLTPAELTDRVSASVVPETVILEITATDPQPQQAQRIAQAVAEQISVLVSDLETPPGEGRAPIKATIVDNAALPQSPTSPQPMRNLVLAAVLGLLLGLGAAILRELMDSSIKSRKDVTDAAGLPVMGNIGYDSTAAKRPLVTSLDLRNPRLEAFRVLRTNMQFVDVDNDSRVYTVTSSVPDEGKTTTSTNLAIMIAQAGQRVLLIEGDLRRPRIHLNSQLEQAVGLTTVLVGRTNLEDAVQKCEVPNLSVLTSGMLPPNPAELLQSRAMGEVIEKARKSYDVVIIDAPPLLPVTDAALLATQSDGALIVVRHGRTTKEQLHHAVERLSAVGGRSLGVVLNMVPGRSTGYSYSSGYGAGPVSLEPVVEQDLAPTVPAPTPASARPENAPATNGRAPAKAEGLTPTVPEQKPRSIRLGRNGKSPDVPAIDTRSDNRPPLVDTELVRVIDHRGWDGLIRRLGGDAAYHSLGYHRASAHLEPEGTLPVLLHHRCNLGESALPLLLRPLPDGSGWDGTSAFGYGGPIAAQAVEDPDFGVAIDEWAHRNHLVASFLRYHPLLGNHRLGPERAEVVRQGYTAVWDLKRRADLLQGMHAHHRKTVRSADRAGLEVRVTRSPRDLSAFRTLYEATPEPPDAREPRIFSDSYWDDLARGCSRNLILVEGFLDSKRAAAILCLTSPPYLHYHLGAASEEGVGISAFSRLFLSAAQWAKANGYSTFHLGGDSGGLADSPLTHRFDPVTPPRPFYVGKWVHEANRYEYLTGSSSTSGIFPPWRAEIEIPGGL